MLHRIAERLHIPGPVTFVNTCENAGDAKLATAAAAIKATVNLRIMIVLLFAKEQTKEPVPYCR